MCKNKKIGRAKKLVYMLIISAFFIFSNADLLHSQEGNISTKAASILQRFKELKKDPDNNDQWVNYLKIFPNTNKEFKKIFDPDDFSELYHNSDQYIFILERAPQNLKREIIKLIFNITKTGAPGCCDAWSALHMATESCALNDINLFMTALKALKQQERQNIIKFMADKEAIRSSEPYQNIINILKSKHENELAKEFEVARKKRIAQPH
jgi:hypothetical protein